MIEPTIGRQVWYYLGQTPENHAFCISGQPMAATVVYVHNENTVNLAVLDHIGKSIFVANCPISQEDGDVDKEYQYCAWMPYQKTQHAHNALIDSAIIASVPGDLAKKGKK